MGLALPSDSSRGESNSVHRRTDELTTAGWKLDGVAYAESFRPLLYVGSSDNGLNDPVTEQSTAENNADAELVHVCRDSRTASQKRLPVRRYVAPA